MRPLPSWRWCCSRRVLRTRHPPWSLLRRLKGRDCWCVRRRVGGTISIIVSRVIRWFERGLVVLTPVRRVLVDLLTVGRIWVLPLMVCWLPRSWRRQLPHLGRRTHPHETRWRWVHALRWCRWLQKRWSWPLLHRHVLLLRHSHYPRSGRLLKLSLCTYLDERCVLFSLRLIGDWLLVNTKQVKRTCTLACPYC